MKQLQLFAPVWRRARYLPHPAATDVEQCDWYGLTAYVYKMHWTWREPVFQYKIYVRGVHHCGWGNDMDEGKEEVMSAAADHMERLAHWLNRRKKA